MFDMFYFLGTLNLNRVSGPSGRFRLQLFPERDKAGVFLDLGPSRRFYVSRSGRLGDASALVAVSQETGLVLGRYGEYFYRLTADDIAEWHARSDGGCAFFLRVELDSSIHGDQLGFTSARRNSKQCSNPQEGPNSHCVTCGARYD